MCEKNYLILSVFVYIQYSAIMPCYFVYVLILNAHMYVFFMRRVSTIYHLTRSFLFLAHSFAFELIEVRDVEVLCVLSAFFLSHAL